jgi:arylformamidase
MAWDLEPGRRLGYEPQDDVTHSTSPWPPSSTGARLIDLTLPFRDGMRGYAWETKHALTRDGWNTRTLHLYSHAGTHMDAQLHFAAGDETIDRIPLERCSGYARVVRLPGLAPGTEITVRHLGATAERLSRGDVLLLATGWSRHVDTPQIYRDGLPRVGVDLARWCVERGVRLLGVEPPSVADVNNLEELTHVHRTLLGGGVVIVEGLTNLEQVPDEGAWFVAAPLRIAGGDGAPCRAFAIVGGIS